MAADDHFAGLGAVRPRLRQDAVFLRSDGGAYLRSDETAFFLRGQRAYRWVSTLGPYLTGEHTVAELCDGLGPDHRDTVLGVVRALLDRGFATDVPPVDGDLLGAEVLARFGRQLAYLQHATGDCAAAGLAAVRAATVQVVGSGEAARSAALSLVRNGIGTVDLLALDEPQAHGAELAAAVAELAADGVASTATARAIGEPPSDRPDVVVHLAGPGELSTLPIRAPDGPGVPLVPVVFGGGTAVLGPVTSPGAAPCWLCAQLRLAATGDPAAASDVWRELALGMAVRPRVGAGSLSVVVAGMLGTAAAFEAFRLLAGLPVDVDGAVVQDTETLESRRQRLFAHPLCPNCHDVPQSAAEQLTEPGTDEERYERLSILVGDRLGVFGRFTDDALTQAPLKVAGIAVTSPAARSGGRRELLAFDDVSVLRARIAVIGAAVLEYVGQLPDRADVVTGDADGLTAAGHRVARPAALATASGVEAEVRRWVPARSLTDGSPTLVPLAAAYPMSSANADRAVEPAPVGAAVGRDRDELVAVGLTGALAYRALRDALHGRGVLCRMESDEGEDATDGVLAQLKGLRHLGKTVAVHDLPGAAPAHAVLATTDRPDGAALWALGHGLDRATAVAGALRELLGRLQVLGDHGRVADLGDPLLPDLDPRTVVPVGDDRPNERPATDVATVLAALASAGRDALLVDTTSADVRSCGALVAGVVLLVDKASRDADGPGDGGRAGGTRTEQGG